MTTSTLTVTEFVLARIAEDEAEARKVEAPLPVRGYATVTLTATDTIAALYVDPARVLAQCAAMRKIVEEHGPKSWGGGRYCPICDAYEVAEGAWSGVGDLGPCDTIRALASIWSDHPDWREEWVA